MVVLIKELEDKIVEVENFLVDIEKEMNAIDPASKDFETLDFEFNYTTGMLLAYRHSLTMAKQKVDTNLE